MTDLNDKLRPYVPGGSFHPEARRVALTELPDGRVVSTVMMCSCSWWVHHKHEEYSFETATFSAAAWLYGVPDLGMTSYDTHEEAKAGHVRIVWNLQGKCGKCDACVIEQLGCTCDGACDPDGCFLCQPKTQPRPNCPC